MFAFSIRRLQELPVAKDFFGFVIIECMSNNLKSKRRFDDIFNSYNSIKSFEKRRVSVIFIVRVSGVLKTDPS